MSKHIKSIAVTVSICVVVTLMLAITNFVTAPIIEKNQSAAANAALLAVQILAVENEELAEKLVAYRKKASDKVLAKNAEIEAKYNG